MNLELLGCCELRHYLNARRRFDLVGTLLAERLKADNTKVGV